MSEVRGSGLNVDVPPRHGRRPGERVRRLAIPALQLHGRLPREGRPGEVTFAAGFAILSVLLLAALPWQTTWAPGTPLSQQPALWPGIALGAMTLFAAGHLIVAIASRQRPGLRAELVAWARPAEFVLWFLAYVWLVPRLGYAIATIAFAATLTWRAGYRGAVWTGLSIAFAMTVVVIFRGFLGVNIPAGDLYGLLPPGPIRAFLMTNL